MHYISSRCQAMEQSAGVYEEYWRYGSIWIQMDAFVVGRPDQFSTYQYLPVVEQILIKVPSPAEVKHGNISFIWFDMYTMCLFYGVWYVACFRLVCNGLSHWSPLFLDAWLGQYKFVGYHNLVNANLVSARQKATLTQIWFSYPCLIFFYILHLLSYRIIYLL